MAADYSPDLAEFSGDRAMALDPKGELAFTGGGTVEFWVAPGWQQPLDYAPVLIASETATSDTSTNLNFAIAISAAKDQLFIYAGDRSAAVDFDFTDGEMHHVVLASLDESSRLMIDGALAARLDFVFLPTPSKQLWVGGLSRESALFHGALAQLRIWDTPLSPQELVDYSMTDEQAAVPHPSLAALRVRSAFNAGQLNLIPFTPVPVALDLE